jgi:hypothetical protein
MTRHSPSRLLDRMTALSAVMVPVRRIGFLIMPAHALCRRLVPASAGGFHRTQRVQRVVLVSDVSAKFKARFACAAKSKKRLDARRSRATPGLAAAPHAQFHLAHNTSGARCGR